VAARRPTAKAIPIGTAVNASEKLWTVSASNATDPESTTITSWNAAVTASPNREIFNARIPSALTVTASSTLSRAS
jgi:hypothetical protein